MKQIDNVTKILIWNDGVAYIYRTTGKRVRVEDLEEIHLNKWVMTHTECGNSICYIYNEDTIYVDGGTLFDES